MEWLRLDERIVLISASIGLSIILVAYMLYIWRRFRAITKLQEALHFEIPPETGEIRTKIWVSNDAERRRWFRIMPATEVGFLVLKPESVVLHSANIDGERRHHQFARDTLKTEWIGNQRLNDSNLQWFALCEGSIRVLVSAYSGINAMPSRQQTAELYRNIVGQHEPFPGTKDFALEKNPASVTALVAMICLFVYAAADGLYFNPLELMGGLKESKYLIIAISFICIAIFEFACFRLLVLKKVPARESLVLAMLLGVAVMAAALPGAKRVDTALAQEPMQSFAYRMTNEGKFLPVDQGPPKLNLQVSCDYWKQYAEDHQHLFPLQQGGLGFWQFDGRELDADIDRYLAAHPEQLK